MAPVVVNPLIVSKKASANRSSVPVITQGNAPTSESTNQARATMANPSRTRSSAVGRNAAHSAPPTATEPLAVAANAHHSASP